MRHERTKQLSLRNSQAGSTGQDGFSDVAAGRQVNVSNASGQLLGYGTLGSGTSQTVSEPGADYPSCVFPFTVSNVPVESLYKIEAGTRGDVSYSLSELEADNWSMTLTLNTESS